MGCTMAFSTMRTFSLDLASKQGDRPNDADLAIIRGQS